MKKSPAEKGIVITFGRFQAISVGHAKLFAKVLDFAKSKNLEHRIYTSHSQDNKKNPLPYASKVSFLRQLFPTANIMESKEITIFQVLDTLNATGYTKVYIVVGDDRVADFKKTMKQYARGSGNPKAYQFDIEIVSAGKRDPNAKGVEGASGTKMREFVKSGDFTSFFKNTPTKNRTLAKTMFDALKKNLREEVEQPLNEGIHDPGIFKAVFLGGGPGSGKDTMLKKVAPAKGPAASGLGLVELNRDHAFEMLMKKSGLSLSMPDSEEEVRNIVRGRSKNVHIERTRLAVTNRQGVIINGTADDHQKILKIKERLEALGYTTMMVFINTSDDVSAARNKMRGQMGGREVPEKIRHEKWKEAQANIDKFRTIFGANFIELDNSIDLHNSTADEKGKAEAAMNAAYKKVLNFVNAPVGRIGQAWIERQKQKRGLTESVRKPLREIIFRKKPQYHSEEE